jgi:hypothetical protein
MLPRPLGAVGSSSMLAGDHWDRTWFSGDEISTAISSVADPDHSDTDPCPDPTVRVKREKAQLYPNDTSVLALSSYFRTVCVRICKIFPVVKIKNPNYSRLTVGRASVSTMEVSDPDSANRYGSEGIRIRSTGNNECLHSYC